MKDRAIFLTARRNEIDALLSREENVQLVKEKLPGFLAAVEKFKEADLAYLSNLQDDIQVKSSLFRQGGPFSTRLVSIGVLRN